MALEAFVRVHVRQVPDPRGGELRLALREGFGPDEDRCRFLEGHNECSVYEARPGHCRDFPYWPSVLEDAQGLELARQVCPGISLAPEQVSGQGSGQDGAALQESMQAAMGELETLYQELQVELDDLNPACAMSGLCCRFEEAGHELFAGGLETQFALQQHPEVPEPEAPGRCPYHVGGMCTARKGRPLACRTYFCDKPKEDTLFELHESYLRRLRAIEAKYKIERVYDRFPQLLLDAHALLGTQAGQRAQKKKELNQLRVKELSKMRT